MIIEKISFSKIGFAVLMTNWLRQFRRDDFEQIVCHRYCLRYVLSDIVEYWLCCRWLIKELLSGVPRWNSIFSWCVVLGLPIQNEDFGNLAHFDENFIAISVSLPELFWFIVLTFVSFFACFLHHGFLVRLFDSLLSLDYVIDSIGNNVIACVFNQLYYI